VPACASVPVCDCYYIQSSSFLSFLQLQCSHYLSTAVAVPAAAAVATAAVPVAMAVAVAVAVAITAAHTEPAPPWSPLRLCCFLSEGPLPIQYWIFPPPKQFPEQHSASLVHTAPKSKQFDCLSCDISTGF